MNRNEILARINACNNELQQRDYTARKVAFEVAKKFKELHPEVNMPILDKYLAGELIADERRKEIDALQKQLEELGEDNGE